METEVNEMKTETDGHFDPRPLSEKIEEAIKLGFNVTDGAKLIGIYDDGYRLICQLIMVRDRHTSPMIRSQAHGWLKKIDEGNGPGSNLRSITNFLARAKVTRTKTFTWRKVGREGQSSVVDQLNELRARADLDEQVKKKIDELLGGVVEGKMLSHNYHDARKLVNEHRMTKRVLAKKMHSSAGYVHAIELACQMCDNLSDIPRARVFEDKIALIARLSSAALVLLEIQKELIEGGINDGSKARQEDRD